MIPVPLLKGAYSMERVLEVKGLSKKYKNNRGIEDISFEINRGDVFGLLGPNGAGKTTAMKAITGLCRADKGEVRILGFDASTQFEKAMQKVGCIIETVEAYEYFSGYRNLELAARFYSGVKASRIHEVLDMVGLSRYANEKVANYSLGMKQRLGLASAVLSGPELVILDEPANGLDIEGTVDIRNTITQLSRDFQISFLISSHLAHEMELTCNKVGIMNEGRLIRTGSVSEFLGSHSSLEDFFIKQIRQSRGGDGYECIACQHIQ